jgi:addiction module RelE/StbE family toxin
MDYSLVFSPLAKKDLYEIVRFISSDNPIKALSFAQFLISKAKQLPQFPEMGRVVPEFQQVQIREIIVRSYRIVYRVNHSKTQIQLIRIWHASRGLPKLK